MTYDFYLELVNKLEAVKEFDLRDSPQSRALADLMSKYEIKNLQDVDRFVREFYIPSQRQLEESPHDRLTSDFLLLLITPMVAALRGYIFGSMEAPFKNYEDAMRWLAEQLAAGAEGHGLLYFLCIKAAEISKITTFTTKSIMEYILLNLEPISHKLALHEHIDVGEVPIVNRRIRNAWLSVHFFSDLSLKDLLELHRNIRSFFGTKRGKNFGEEHLELYRMVLQRGGPPTKGVVSFWESIKQEWNGKHKKGRHYQTWKGVKIAYDRICKKLEAKYQGGEKSAEDLSAEFEMPEVIRRDLRWLRQQEVKEDETD